LYSLQELFAEANILVVAGSDTTFFNMCGFFFYIGRNLRSYEKLVNEIRSTFGSLGREGGAWILAGRGKPGARLTRISGCATDRSFNSNRETPEL